MSLLGSRDAGAGAFEIEDELAGVGLVLVAEGECHQGGDVGTSIVGAAGNESTGSVEVNGASFAVVLRGKVWEDGCNGLGVGDNGWAAVSRGRSSRSIGNKTGGVGVAAGLTTSNQGSSIGKSAEAEDGSEDVGRGETGGSGHFILFLDGI